MRIVKKIQRKMIKSAQKMYPKIYPCGINSSFKDCFTFKDDFVYFWFNTQDKTTHLITAKKSDVARYEILK